MKKDTSLPNIDESVHLTASIISYYHIKNLHFENLVKISSYYPPFYPILTFCSYFIFGISKYSALLINLFFLTILILSTFLIGRKIKNDELGIVSAFLISFYPIIFVISRKYYSDLALASLVSLFIYLLIASENFKNRMLSIFLGVVFGCGMLTKWTFLFFTIVPIFGIILKRENFKRDKIFNFLLFVFISVFISSLWYIPNIKPLYKNLQLGNILDVKTDPTFFQFEFYIYYLKSLITSQIYIFFFILFLFSFIFFIFKKKNRGEEILFSHILSSYLFLTFILNKDSRFFLPCLSAIAILSAIFISEVKIKKILFPVIIIFAVIQFFVFSYKIYPPKKEQNQEIIKCVDIIKQDILQSEKNFINILIASDNPSFNLWTFRYFFYKNFLDYVKKYYIKFDGIENKSIKYDYAIIKYNNEKEIENISSFKKKVKLKFQNEKFILVF